MLVWIVRTNAVILRISLPASTSSTGTLSTSTFSASLVSKVFYLDQPLSPGGCMEQSDDCLCQNIADFLCVASCVKGSGMRSYADVALASYLARKDDELTTSGRVSVVVVPLLLEPKLLLKLAIPLFSHDTVTQRMDNCSQYVGCGSIGRRNLILISRICL